MAEQSLKELKTAALCVAVAVAVAVALAVALAAAAVAAAAAPAPFLIFKGEDSGLRLKAAAIFFIIACARVS